ncbi:MAG: hypothetical protein SFW65_00495 [Alphaproteobacteria bacterium]|nr:hypothetical protein [Alphaproteobacteria bacterium]
MSDKIKNPEDKKYPTASHMEELGSSTAEAICAGMKAANDDAPSFGPSRLGTSITGLSGLDADTLASALNQLKAHVNPKPFYKAKFMQKFKLILGKDDKK